MRPPGAPPPVCGSPPSRDAVERTLRPSCSLAPGSSLWEGRHPEVRPGRLATPGSPGRRGAAGGTRPRGAGRGLSWPEGWCGRLSFLPELRLLGSYQLQKCLIAVSRASFFNDFCFSGDAFGSGSGRIPYSLPGEMERFENCDLYFQPTGCLFVFFFFGKREGYGKIQVAHNLLTK